MKFIRRGEGERGRRGGGGREGAASSAKLDVGSTLPLPLVLNIENPTNPATMLFFFFTENMVDIIQPVFRRSIEL